ncbi:retropepsin-like aspartic protease family protein [Dyella telluris]|uniref:Retropepsin-like domain-containing protein n=1 Tax=Dyella telluris TaxID=2763498 RepID=A0A7G8Q2L3_9GAMM|nr:retropepsin-like aspartic protease [Dyella telluris]QNK01021.1 retropepsin-like domain-containing protein [Dyella telluris]
MKRAPLALLLSLSCLAVSAGPITPTADTTASPPLSRQQAEDALLHAADGEVFALAAALPRMADQGLSLLAQARLAATQLDAAQAHRLVVSYLASGPHSPADRAVAWPIVADASFADGNYPQAADAARHWERALIEQNASADDRASALQMAVIAEQLAAAPRQHVDAYAPKVVTVTRDKVGLPRANAVINGKLQEAVLDTGANLSTVSLSTARRLGLRMLDGSASVGSASRQAVTSRIGIADHFAFAGLSLSHVAFLVLDDEQLKMPVPGGYQIDAILGFPVLRQLQRLEFTADGSLRPSRSDASASADGNLRMAGSDLYVNVMLDDMPVAMQLDSGGARSALSSRFASEHPSLVRGLKTKKEHVAGAGGSHINDSATWADVRVRIGDQQTVLPAISVTLSNAGSGKDTNLLGGDILQAFDHWTIDFQRMQFEVGKPLAKPATRPRAE